MRIIGIAVLLFLVLLVSGCTDRQPEPAPGTPTIPTVECGRNDFDCQAYVTQLLDNCTSSNINLEDTISISVHGLEGSNCLLTETIINHTGTVFDEDVEGKSMECSFPLGAMGHPPWDDRSAIVAYTVTVPLALVSDNTDYCQGPLITYMEEYLEGG